MTKYVANENGDWWEIVEGESLYLIDTDWENIVSAMKEEEVSPNDDKFERFIWRYGTEVNIDMSRWVKV
jgi:hypothetical protein